MRFSCNSPFRQPTVDEAAKVIDYFENIVGMHPNNIQPENSTFWEEYQASCWTDVFQEIIT